MPLRPRRFAEHVPRDPSSPWFGEHLARYRLAAEAAAGARVLELACGSGLGLATLAQPARYVAGADLDPSALREAAAAGDPGVGLARVHGSALPYRAGSFDLISCMETIEHVEDDHGLVAELARVVAPGGVAFVSTPNAIVTRPRDGRPRNPFHVREYEPDELQDVLRARFDDVEVLGQRPAGAYARCGFWLRQPGLRGAVEALGLKLSLRAPRPVVEWVEQRRGRPLFPGPDQFSFDTGDLRRSHALLAVCRQPRPGR